MVTYFGKDWTVTIVVQVTAVLKIHCAEELHFTIFHFQYMHVYMNW